jgi:hypothetical protein
MARRASSLTLNAVTAKIPGLLENGPAYSSLMEGALHHE